MITAAIAAAAFFLITELTGGVIMITGMIKEKDKMAFVGLGMFVGGWILLKATALVGSIMAATH